MHRFGWLTIPLLLICCSGAANLDLERLQMHVLAKELKTTQHRVVFESNRSGDWDIWIVNADGSGLRNLTSTPDMDEINAHASPDGTKIVFIGDRVRMAGRRRITHRATYLMNMDGSGRLKIAERVQNPAWNHDGTAIALVRSNPTKPTTEYYTRGLMIYDLKTKRTQSVRPGFFTGIFALTWSPDGKWFLFAQRGMRRFGYQLLMTDAEGRYVYPIRNYGCRPDFSPDGKRIAWNTSDQHIAVGRINTAGLQPGRRDPVTLTDLRVVARTRQGKVYYVDWSPDGRYLAYARGHARKVGHSFKGTGDWRIWVTRATELHPTRLPIAVPLTSPPPGKDDKEPDWVPIPKPIPIVPAGDDDDDDDAPSVDPLPPPPPADPERKTEIDRIIDDWIERMKKDLGGG